MKKSDLRSGMRITTRSGHQFIVILNPCVEARELIGVNGGFASFHNFDENLNGIDNFNQDIVKIEHPQVFIALMIVGFNNIRWQTIWKREDRKKELSLADIESAFGLKVRIVEEEK